MENTKSRQGGIRRAVLLLTLLIVPVYLNGCGRMGGAIGGGQLLQRAGNIAGRAATVGSNVLGIINQTPAASAGTALAGQITGSLAQGLGARPRR